MADTAVRDVELTRSLARGDEAALRQLYERHGGLVLALATRMLGSREEAEEVLHDTFYRLWQNAHRFDPERAAVRTYLYALARNLCLSRLRARRSRPVAADLEDGQGDRPPEVLEPPRAAAVRHATEHAVQVRVVVDRQVRAPPEGQPVTRRQAEVLTAELEVQAAGWEGVVVGHGAAR